MDTMPILVDRAVVWAGVEKTVVVWAVAGVGMKVVG
jgi:hypothetical protein